MTDLSTWQLIIVGAIGIIAVSVTGVLLIFGILHLREKYTKKPTAGSGL